MKTHYQKILELMKGQGSTIIDSVANEVVGDSYNEFYRHPQVTAYVDKVYPNDPATALSSLNMYYHTFLMKKHGEKIFVLEKDVALLLTHTEIKGVTGDMLKTPYREQLIVLPPDFDLIDLQDPTTGLHTLDSVYVSYDEKGELRLLAVGRPNENSPDEYDDTFAYFRFNFDSRDLKLQVKEHVERHRNSAELDIIGGRNNLEICQRLFDFILNVLLYISSPEADKYFETWADVDPSIKKMRGKAKKRAVKSLRARNNFLKIRVGMKTRLDKESRESYIGGRKIDKRTLVMGHWQHYWIGQGRTDKVLKWKQPFWKGMGELSNVPHKL